MDEALWRNVRHAAGSWPGGFAARALVFSGREPLRPSGRGEGNLLPASPDLPEGCFSIFGRQDTAHVEVSGPGAAVEAVRRARFGM
jgi:hypothetical protein